jgi:hypothetical protein
MAAAAAAAAAAAVTAARATASQTDAPVRTDPSPTGLGVRPCVVVQSIEQLPPQEIAWRPHWRASS